MYVRVVAAAVVPPRPVVIIRLLHNGFNAEQSDGEVPDLALAHLAVPGALDGEPLDGAVLVRQRELALARALQLQGVVAAFR
jgi:hypothetical protein